MLREEDRRIPSHDIHVATTPAADLRYLHGHASTSPENAPNSPDHASAPAPHPLA